MVGTKSRENSEHFDRFECLSCHSVISEVRTRPPGDDGKSR